MAQSSPAITSRPAIFVMRDGVLCEPVAGDVHSWDECALLSGALEGLRLLAALDADVIALTPAHAGTHPGRSRGVTAVDDAMRASLSGLGARLDDVVTYHAHTERAERVHHDLTRLLRRVARQRGVSLCASVLLTDTWADAEAALAAGCQPVLVMTGRGREQIARPQLTCVRARTWYAADIAMAALSIEAQLSLQPAERAVTRTDPVPPTSAADPRHTQTVA